jgi:DNA-binding NtrC family response regulator
MNWLSLQTKKAADLPAVLIVEDDEGMRDVLTRGVSMFGYKPLIADDAETALGLLSNQPLVAIVDVHLPGANGLWLGDQIRAASPTTAIIFATGNRRLPATETLRPHVVAYLVKPFSMQKLREAVERGIEWSEGRRRGGAEARKAIGSGKTDA